MKIIVTFAHLESPYSLIWGAPEVSPQTPPTTRVIVFTSCATILLLATSINYQIHYNLPIIIVSIMATTTAINIRI